MTSEELRNKYIKREIPFSEYVRQVPKVQQSRWRIVDNDRACKLGISIPDYNHIIIGHKVFPNDIDGDEDIEWLINEGIIEKV